MAATAAGRATFTGGVDEFVLRVLRYVREADAEARLLAGEAARQVVRVGRRSQEEADRLDRWLHGFCAGCGCPHDEQTPGCTNCNSRHSQRRRHGKGVEA